MFACLGGAVCVVFWVGGGTHSLSLSLCAFLAPLPAPPPQTASSSSHTQPQKKRTQQTKKQAAHLGRVPRRAPEPQPHRLHRQGALAVQRAQRRDQRRDLSAAAGRRDGADGALQPGQRDVRAGEERLGVEHQELPRRQGVFAARALQPAERRGRGGGARQDAADQGQVRDPLLYGLGRAGAVFCLLCSVCGRAGGASAARWRGVRVCRRFQLLKRGRFALWWAFSLVPPLARCWRRARAAASF